MQMQHWRESRVRGRNGSCRRGACPSPAPTAPRLGSANSFTRGHARPVSVPPRAASQVETTGSTALPDALACPAWRWLASPSRSVRHMRDPSSCLARPADDESQARRAGVVYPLVSPPRVFTPSRLISGSPHPPVPCACRSAPPTALGGPSCGACRDARLIYVDRPPGRWLSPWLAPECIPSVFFASVTRSSVLSSRGGAPSYIIKPHAPRATAISAVASRRH